MNKNFKVYLPVETCRHCKYLEWIYENAIPRCSISQEHLNWKTDIWNEISVNCPVKNEPARFTNLPKDLKEFISKGAQNVRKTN